MWHHINEEGDDKSFMRVKRDSWGLNFFALFSKYECVGNVLGHETLTENGLNGT
jgi:hypothetical protein